MECQHWVRQGTGCDSPEAADYIASYFGKYPGVKIYMDEMKAKAKDQGLWRQLLAEGFIYLVFILAERAWQQSEQLSMHRCRGLLQIL